MQAEHAHIAEQLKAQYAESITDLDLQHAEVLKTLDGRHAEALQTARAQWTAEKHALEADKRALREELSNLTARLEAAAAEQEQLTLEINHRQTRIYLLEDLHHALPEAEKRIGELEDEHKKQQASYAQLENAHRELNEKYQQLDSIFQNVLRSHSWRLTSPMRKLVETIQGRS